MPYTKAPASAFVAKVMNEVLLGVAEEDVTVKITLRHISARDCSGYPAEASVRWALWRSNSGKPGPQGAAK